MNTSLGQINPNNRHEQVVQYWQKLGQMIQNYSKEMQNFRDALFSENDDSFSNLSDEEIILMAELALKSGCIGVAQAIASKAANAGLYHITQLIEKQIHHSNYSVPKNEFHPPILDTKTSPTTYIY